ncbi:MAG: hypothetical protein Q7K54_03530 [Candidatus Parcubacteria bacterium]|nr:hypothetical protein [Candidatus Parcubacteria bacterium]
MALKKGKEKKKPDALELFARPSESIIGGHVPSEGILAKQSHKNRKDISETVVCGPIVQSVFGGDAKGGVFRD